MFRPSQHEIRQAIDSFRIRQKERFSKLDFSNASGKLRSAAVIISLLLHEGRWHVLLTHRSEGLVEHRGQFAYPGGACEHGDEGLQGTALREMYEEIGVHPR